MILVVLLPKLINEQQIQIIMLQYSTESQRQNKFVIRYVDHQSLIKGFRKSSIKIHRSQKKSERINLQKQQSKEFFKNSKARKTHAIQTEISTSVNSKIKNTWRTASQNEILKSKSQQRDTQKPQFSRIPIQYYDQRQNGCPADKIRYRVVYRGYAPKNTYFFFKAIHSINEDKHNSRSFGILSDYELNFNSKFQSGNLIAASRISAKQYWLFMRQDTNTNGLRQWFYFQVQNRKPAQIKFRIYRFSKKYSLYQYGMRPYIKTDADWSQGGQKVKYEYDGQQGCYYLQFQYTFQQSNSITSFATLPPYTYTNLFEYLEKIKDQPYIRIRSLGVSLAGLDIPILQIKGNKSLQKKEAIFMIARTHPGQTCSNFTLQSLINQILEKSKQSKKHLLDIFDFYIVPMVNPDGVYLGNHRTCSIGADMNRYFFQNQPELFPEVCMIIEQVQRISQNQQIILFLDLHGHSAKKNIFAYAQEHEIGEKKYLMSRILPKILSQKLSIFKYDHCVFRAIRQKKTTARVFFSNKFKLNSITFQQSYGLTNEGDISILTWRNFGLALYDSLLTFSEMKDNGISSIKDYLQPQIQEEKLRIEKRLQKQKKILLQMVNFKVEQDKDNIDNKMHIEEQKVVAQKQEDQKEDSVNDSQLDSEDEDLQFDSKNFQQLKKEIVRVGCFKEVVKREIFMMADKKLQLTHWDINQQPKLYNQKSSLAPRILKFQMKRQQATIPLRKFPNIKK